MIETGSVLSRVWLCGRIAVLLVAVARCGTDERSDSLEFKCADGQPGPVYAELSGFDICAGCHSVGLEGGKRNGAPAAINFDDYGNAAQYVDEALAQIRSGSMPPPGAQAPLTTAQLEDIERWADCGTPE